MRRQLIVYAKRPLPDCAKTRLGARMTASFAQAFAAGAEAVVLTCSDIPGLDSHLVPLAFDRSAQAPVVIGPAGDGGYYLIGMRAPDSPCSMASSGAPSACWRRPTCWRSHKDYRSSICANWSTRIAETSSGVGGARS